jgi:hypothetical protein
VIVEVVEVVLKLGPIVTVAMMLVFSVAVVVCIGMAD